MAFDSVNVREADGAARWIAAGRPVVPSLVVDGVASPILHVSQLASMLGLEAPPQLEVTRLAWDAAAVLGAWVELIQPLDFETLTAPTPSRERSLRNLTVNVFHPFELLPGAWANGRFLWEPERDEERERALRGPADVVDYAARILAAWTEFVLEHGDDLGQRDPLVSSPRGDILLSALLESQLEHVSFHHGQLVAFLDRHE